MSRYFAPLGIPHPESHIVQCLAFKRHWKDNKRTLREIQLSPASRIFVRRLRDKRVFEMNYRAGDRYRNEEADIWNRMGAHFLVKTDISNCFPSIYTHSIPWALHGREQAKGDRRTPIAGKPFGQNNPRYARWTNKRSHHRASLFQRHFRNHSD